MPARDQHQTVWFTTLPTPLGLLGLAGTSQGLTHIDFQNGDRPVPCGSPWPADSPLLEAAQRQLGAYFRGCRQPFTLPLAPAGTPFQQRVWQALQQIPFGTTLTYQELARRLGKPGAARAVGHANGRNPLAIVIPCHRLLGSDGRLRGYASGLTFKRRLLHHEGVQCIETLSHSFPSRQKPLSHKEGVKHHATSCSHYWQI
jgi:methylated-DNA-[protein]-cysteine S-methyltransferase